MTRLTTPVMSTFGRFQSNHGTFVGGRWLTPIVAGLLVLCVAVHAAAQEPTGTNVIRLRVRQFEPPAGVESLPPVAGAPGLGGRRHLLIQFSTPLSREQLDAFEAATGATVLRVVPNNTAMVALPAAVDLSAVSAVRWAGTLAPADKFEAQTRSAVESASGFSFVVVEFHPDTSAAQIADVVFAAGGEVWATGSVPPYVAVVRMSDVATFDALAADESVAWMVSASEAVISDPSGVFCPGAVASLGSVASYAANDDGWDGPGRGEALLAYFLGAGTPDVNGEDGEVRRALDEWSRYAAISWNPVAVAYQWRSLDIFWTANPAHGDGFPFGSSTLAHAFFPSPPNPETIAGDIHFNDAFAWRVGVDYDVFSVALHEAGHSLGLGHSSEPGAVMYPFYKRVVGLAPDDIAAIRSIYANACTRQLLVTPSWHDFGFLPVGESADRSFTIQNTGTCTLTGEASVSPPFSIVSGGTFTLGQAETQSILVRFEPTTTGIASESVSVSFTGGSLARPVLGFAIPEHTDPTDYPEPPTGATLAQRWRLDGDLTSSVDGTSCQFAGNDDTASRFAPGHLGEALRLDGIDDYVDCGNASAVQVSGQGDFSVAAWVYFEALGHPPGQNTGAPQGDMSIVDKMAGADQGLNWEGWRLLKQDDQHFWFCLGGSAMSPPLPGGNGCTPDSPLTVRSSVPAVLHEWTYLVAVRTASFLKIYVNGVLSGVRTLPPGTDTSRNSANLRLGSYVLEGSHLNGSLDDVRLFRGALTDSEVAMLATSGVRPAPAAFAPGWSFDANGGHISASARGPVRRLEYDVRAPDSFAGQALDFGEPFDAGDANMLTFRIKGDLGGEHVLIGLRDTTERERKVLVSKFLAGGVGAEWRSAYVPLDVFTGVDRRHLLRLVWAFEHRLGAEAGAVEIEDVRLENAGTVLPVPVENFDDRIALTAPGGTWWTVAGGSGAVTGEYQATPSGTAYRITALANPPDGWAVAAFDLGGLNVVQQQALSFWIRGARGGEHPNVYLASGSPGAETRRLVDLEAYAAVTMDWTRVVIPLVDFARQGVDLTRVLRLELAWEWAPLSESVVLDDIAFEPSGVPPAVRLAPRSGFSFASPTGSIAVEPSDSGYRFAYDVREPGSYAGHALRYEAPLDASAANVLSFRVKGDLGGEHVLVGIRDAGEHEQKVVVSKFLSRGVSAEWRSVYIPLEAFTSVDRHQLTSIVWAFEHQLGAEVGAVEIDNVRFENTGTTLPLPVENFDDRVARTGPGGNWWAVAGGGGVINGAYDVTPAGTAYRITTSVAPPSDWAVMAFDLGGLNVVNQQALTFWIRGDLGGEHPNVYLVSGSGGTETRRLVNLEAYVSLTTDWTQVVIPLVDFAQQGVDLTCLRRLEFAWEWEPLSESVVLDDIEFQPFWSGNEPS